MQTPSTSAETLPSALDRAERLAALTARYARFSGSFGGLGTALGGALGLAMLALLRLGPPELRPWLVAIPFVWILAREVLRQLYYQRHGRVREVPSRYARIARGVFVGAFAVTGWGVALAFLLRRGLPSSPQVAAQLLIMIAAPLYAYVGSTSRTDAFVAVGVFLPAMTAAVSDRYASARELNVGTFFAGFALLFGIYAHIEFRRVRRELAALQRGELPTTRLEPDVKVRSTRGLASVLAALTAAFVVGAAAAWPAHAASALPLAAVAYLAVHQVAVWLLGLEPLPALPTEAYVFVMIAMAIFYAAFFFPFGDTPGIPPAAIAGGVAIGVVFGALFAGRMLALFETIGVGWLAIEACMVQAGLAPRIDLALTMLALTAAWGVAEHVQQQRLRVEAPRA